MLAWFDGCSEADTLPALCQRLSTWSCKCMKWLLPAGKSLSEYCTAVWFQRRWQWGRGRNSPWLYFSYPEGKIVFLWRSHPEKYCEEIVAPLCLCQWCDGVTLNFALRLSKHLVFSVCQHEHWKHLQGGSFLRSEESLCMVVTFYIVFLLVLLNEWLDSEVVGWYVYSNHTGIVWLLQPALKWAPEKHQRAVNLQSINLMLSHRFLRCH